MAHTGTTGGTSVPAGDSYISSAIDVKGVPQAAAAILATNLLGFLEIFIPTLLTQKFSTSPFNPSGTGTRVPEIELYEHISFTQLTDFVYPFKAPFKGKTFLHLENNSKRVLLRRDKLKKKLLLVPTVHVTETGPVPFEIQIRSNSPPDTNFPDTRQVDFMLYYLAKVGYAGQVDSTRIKLAFQQVYRYVFVDEPGYSSTDVDDVSELEISFTSPVQIGVNDRNCGGYEIPGSDKRTAIAVLHDKVECISALINDLSSNPVTGPILPQYVAYDHGLVMHLDDPAEVLSLPTLPVDWQTWYSTNANNPTREPYGIMNDMNENLREWVTQGKVLVFKSPLGAGTLSIYLTGFPFEDQQTDIDDDNGHPEAKDGAYIRLCNGNDPYNAKVNPNNGNSAYDDRFIFYDQYYRVLANITPGESVRVTWCATQPIPGWISIVGT